MYPTGWKSLSARVAKKSTARGGQAAGRIPLDRGLGQGECVTRVHILGIIVGKLVLGVGNLSPLVRIKREGSEPLLNPRDCRRIASGEAKAGSL